MFCFLLAFPWPRCCRQPHHSDPRIPPPHYIAVGAWPPEGSHLHQGGDSAHCSPSPAACTASQAGVLLSPGPPRPPEPSSGPAPVFPARILPATGGLECSGEAACGRMAVSRDVETVTSASWSPWPSHRPRVCWQRRVGVCGRVFLIFFFISLDSSSFFKDEILTRIALHMLGTGWKDFGIAVGGGGTPTTKQTCCFRSCFYFQKPTRDSGACLLPGGVARPPSPQHPPRKPLCLAPETPEFFVHLLPPPRPLPP